MTDFHEWRDDVARGAEPLVYFFAPAEKTGMTTFAEWREEGMNESAAHTRYSVEVNYRTTADEALEAFAKIALGYVSAAMKQYNYHVKHVYTEKPLRILVASRNWDDGEWVGVVSWNPEHKCFVVSKGFYNKTRRTVSMQDSKRCDGSNAADITRHVYNLMHGLKRVPDKWQPKLKPVRQKRGPKS
jgi:hypothetical protein